MSLRSRLLVSYVVILLVTLTLVGVMLVVFLRSRPVPTGPLVQDLTTTLLDIGVRSLGEVSILTPEGQRQAEIISFLNEEALLSDKRLMILTSDERVVYDSAGGYPQNSIVNTVEREVLLSAGTRPRTVITQGRFRDPDGSEWIYVSQMLMRRGVQGPAVTVAAPVPRPRCNRSSRLSATRSSRRWCERSGRAAGGAGALRADFALRRAAASGDQPGGAAAGGRRHQPARPRQRAA